MCNKQDVDDMASVAGTAPGGSRTRKLILDKVRQLGPTEHHEIFTLLKTHDIAYSSNSNGVFINLSTVPDDVLATVKKFVDYCALNKTGLDEYEKKLQECKITHKFDIITSLADGRQSTSPVTRGTDVSNAPSAAPVVSTSHSLMSSRTAHVGAAAVNSVPNVLISGRFQVTKKRFSRRKIVDRKQLLVDGGSDGGLTGVLMPEAYTYTHQPTC